jgi:type I restriction enzyme R subunit
MNYYNIIAATSQATVVAECPVSNKAASAYQSEAQMEAEFIAQLQAQGYDYITFSTEKALINNLRVQLEALNNFSFTEGEWKRFFEEKIASANEGIVEKTRRIQNDEVQVFKREDGSFQNIRLIDKTNIHNNRLQVLNQYEEAAGAHLSRYDVTILVNGLPLVHVELKRRGVAIKEAFNQIQRYQRESFWGSSGLFEYVQIFVISNGTYTKYYSNTTRNQHIKDLNDNANPRAKKTSHSFEFTNFWADGTNRVIPDLVDFTATFFAKHTLLNILIHYCVFTSEDLLLVMRPYQIAATERVLTRILTSSNNKQTGSLAAGGYIWHTTGSGKTLTSFKAAQLATSIPGVEKVVFVVDRRDLDYQTMCEYDRYQKGAANGNTSTKMLQKQLEDPAARIIITTIQKLDVFISRNKQHEIYRKHVVLIFDECHRSQFGGMHQAIIKAFKHYHIFGFTGTPIFAINAGPGVKSVLKTTEQAFGEKLHTYTIVDAINDGNVLPFRVDYINTVKIKDGVVDAQVSAIDREAAMLAPERISKVTEYLLDHFDQKTLRDSGYVHKGVSKKGFNAIFATASIAQAKLYYNEIRRQLQERGKPLKVAIIFSYQANEELFEDGLPDEGFETDKLDRSSRDFLEAAIGDYNQSFNTNYDTSSEKFQNYYKDVSKRVKARELDLLVVVDMFLTGFDATTLNTLWVDKNLRQHGLIQAFSRTNRILNSVKAFGNIVCFRDLSKETDEAIAIFGNKDAGGIVLLKTFEEYYHGYEAKGQRQPGYLALISELETDFPLGQPILGEQAEKDFVQLYGAILRLRNILHAFDEFEGHEILTERNFQDYQSRYIDIYDKKRGHKGGEAVNINDDLVFEIELIKQVEVNIDYILLMLVKYRDSLCQDKSILVSIEKAIDASLELRSKKELIEGFIAQVTLETEVERDWQAFVSERKEADLNSIIESEKLKENETRRYVEGSFRDREMKTTGTEFTGILPPTDIFKPGYSLKKQTVIEKLRGFFEKYLGLG